MHRGANFVGTWISAYFEGGVEALADNRGGDHRSKLTSQEMQELKKIITTSYPLYVKGWDRHMIADLIEYHFKVQYPRNSVYHILKRLNLTHKIATWKEEIKKLLKLTQETVLLAQDESRFISDKKFVDFITDLVQNINKTDKTQLLNLYTSLI